jgi:signal peptidase
MKTGGTSKVNLVKIALLGAVALCAALVGSFGFGVFHSSSWWYVGFLALGLLVTWFVVGFRPRRSADGAAASQIVVVYVLFYLVLIYLLGLVTGFLQNGYSSALGVMVRNVLPVIGVAVLSELWRYALVKRIGDHRLALVGVAVLFYLLNILAGIGSYDLSLPVELYEMIGQLVLGGAAMSALLTFVAWKSDFRPTLIYVLVMAIYPVALPILPDLGPFIYSVLAIMLPTLLFIRFNEFFVTKRAIPTRQKRSGRLLMSLPAVVGLGVVVILVSGIFRYWAMAIGSDSMLPEIGTGDVVVIDKGYGEAENLEVGSVLAFRRDGRVIAHRLLAIKQDSNGLKFQTKGDNNDNDDAWLVRLDDIVGVVRWKIPLIGWPTVWLDRMMS